MQRREIFKEYKSVSEAFETEGMIFKMETKIYKIYVERLIMRHDFMVEHLGVRSVSS